MHCNSIYARIPWDTRNENIHDNAVFQKKSRYISRLLRAKGNEHREYRRVILVFGSSNTLIAFVGTVVVFACFSLSALLAKRRSYLYISGFLSSAMSLMFWMSLANMWFRSAAMYNLQIYGGLLLFSGYVIVDTQMIVEKAENGERDYLWHAAELFTDFVALFVRILIILMRNAQNGRKREMRIGDVGIAGSLYTML